MTPLRLRGLLLSVLTLLPLAASAQGFSALVSPPRFEDSARAGETYRNVIEITNVSERSATYLVRTADWTFAPDATIGFSDALAPGSCRPWVGIEAPQVAIAGNGKRRFRFEVAVPADAPAGECRFALMIEGEPETTGGGVAMPVSGRIAVIVYLAIGDAAPALSIVAQRTAEVDGQVLPVLTIRNAGNAHGRLAGFVDGVDAQGRKFAFAPGTLPILPGEDRDIALAPQPASADEPPPQLAWPVRLRGRLESGRQRIDVDATVAR